MRVKESNPGRRPKWRTFIGPYVNSYARVHPLDPFNVEAYPHTHIVMSRDSLPLVKTNPVRDQPGAPQTLDFSHGTTGSTLSSNSSLLSRPSQNQSPSFFFFFSHTRAYRYTTLGNPRSHPEAHLIPLRVSTRPLPQDAKGGFSIPGSRTQNRFRYRVFF